MNDIVIGIILLSAALIFATFFLFYDRFIIEKIARKKIHSLKEIIQEVFHGKAK